LPSRRYRGLHLVSGKLTPAPPARDPRAQNQNQSLSQTRAIVAQVEREIQLRAQREQRTRPDSLHPVPRIRLAAPASSPAQSARRFVKTLLNT
jgi:hypothetical protein